LGSLSLLGLVILGGVHINFLGVEDILNSPNNDVDKFYTDEENYMFIREVTADSFMSIFMARGREKEQEKYGKSEELTSGVSFTTDIKVYR
jgi:hypothetical protein